MRGFSRKVSLLCLFFMISSLCGCNNKAISSKTSGNDSGKKISVVATLFPQYDFAVQVLKEKGDVTLLLPPGTEAHSFDPSPGDISKICSSDIFVYTGKHMEPWSDKIISSVSSSNIEVLDVSKGIEVEKGCCCGDTHNDKCHGDDACKGHNHEYDPHIWLDPTLAIKMVDNILESVLKRSPENKNYFEKNANELKDKLRKLDADFENLISSAKNKNMVFVGRFSHFYFIKRYKINHKTTFKGCFAEAEPSVKRVSKIVDYIKENKISVLYYEELSEPKIAKSIAEQTDARLLRFSACHNLTKNEADSGITYLDIMTENFKNLKEGIA